MDNDRIFLEFWQDYQWPDAKPVLFRLYHDEQGRPLEYSQEDHAGQYTDITPEQFVRADFRVRIVNGSIIPQDPPLPPSLRRDSTGVRCHALDVTVITHQEPSQSWSMKQNEN
jgi:hypothetical protein